MTPGDEVVLCTTGEGTTSEGEFWEALNSASNLKLPVVFLVEDNGYAISVPVEVNTAGGSISKLVRGYPDLLVLEVDGCDPLASYDALMKAHDHCRLRKGPALVHAKVIRPYSHSLSDDEVHYRSTAEREADAARDPLVTFPRYLHRAGCGDRGGAGDDPRRRSDDEVNVATDVALASPQPALDTIYDYVYSPTSTRRPSSSTPRTTRSSVGEPTTMVDLLNVVHEGRDDARPPDPGLRTGCGRRVTRVDASRRQGEGRRVQGDLGAAEAVRRQPGVQLAPRRSQHRGPRHRSCHPRDEAGRRDPVLRLHLAGLHADPQRARADALAVEQRQFGAGGGARHVWRISQGWRGVPLADGRRDLHRHSRPPRDLPEHGARRQRTAAHRDPVRRPGAVPGAQAPLPSGVQQGHLSGPQLHDPVRQGERRPRGHRRRRS